MGRRNHPRNGVVMIKILHENGSVDQTYELDEHGKLKYPITTKDKSKPCLTAADIATVQNLSKQEVTMGDMDIVLGDESWNRLSVGMPLDGLDISIFDVEASGLFL